MASEHNQVVFKVRKDATKPQIKAAVEQLFDVKVEAVNTLDPQGQDEGVPRLRGPQSDVKKADRDARRGPQDRRDHRSLSRLRNRRDGTEDIQTDHAEPAPARDRRPQRALQGQAGQGADRGQVVRPAAATTPAASRCGSAAAATSRRYRIVDFKRRKLDVPAKVERLEYDPNRTGVHRADHAMRTASRPTSSRRSASRSATRSSSGSRST